jgi:ribosome biogenesis GTPase / thiamine phosphate phosphatase
MVEPEINKDLGFDNYQSSDIRPEGFEQARVIAEHKELYRVKTFSHEYFAKVTGKQIFSAVSREDFPAVGDFVGIEILDNDQAVIKTVLPRKSVIKKRRGNSIQIIATNVDVAFVVESVDRDYNINRLERYCALCLQEKIEPVVVINKIDLISADELALKLQEIQHRLPEVSIISTSVPNSDGLNELKLYIKKGITYCFLGSSGVGKSSIINKLFGKELIKTEEIGKGTGRGKHTTTAREMFFLPNGGILIDNPGMREVGLADFESGISQVFDDFVSIAKQCKFADCTHTNEPGCAVLEALNKGQLDEDQYDNYLKLKKEVEHFEMTDQEKREKDRKFGKFVKNYSKKIKEEK